MVVFTLSFYAQQVYNNGFEDWKDNNDAIGWTTKIESGSFVLHTAKRTDDAYAGNYAAELKTQNVLGIMVPGVIQLGTLNDDLEPVGGVPFTARPTAISVKLKYTPVDGDSLIIFSYLSKANKKTKSSTKIGACFFSYNQQVSDYQTFLIPIYYISEDIPDTLNVFFSSSYKQITAGSELIVDSLEFLYGDYLLPPQANFPNQLSDTGFMATWQGADFTKGYYLDVAYDKDFINFLPNYDNVDVGDTLQHFVPLQDTSKKEIYYRVRADYDSVISENSIAVSFPIPYAPIVLPASQISSKSFLARWQNIPNADFYIFQVCGTEQFSGSNDVYYDAVALKTNQYAVVGLEPDKDYYYRVKANYPISGKSDVSSNIKVHTTSDMKTQEVSVFFQKNKATIYIDTLSYLNSEAYFYTLDGRMVWNGVLTNRFVEVPDLPAQVLLFIIISPEGDIIRRKVSFLE